MKNSKPIIKYTPATLANSIGMRPESLMRKMNEMGLKYGRHDILPEDTVIELLERYSEHHPQRPDEVVEKAQEIYQQINLQINFPDGSDGKPDSRLITQTVSKTVTDGVRQLPDGTDNEADGKGGRTDGNKMVTVLAYLAFVFILIFQMEHVASVGTDVSTFTDETARKVSGWLFAFTFNLTALVMTIKRGIKAKVQLFKRDVSYILLFAVLDVIFFVISSGPIEGSSDRLMWGKSILVGSATAFVIYSFNELVTNK